MTLFNPEFESIQADINYHQEQIAEAEERLDQIKVAQAYSDTAIASLEDCIQNIDPFYLPILRGHIESMFSQTNNEVKEVKEPPQEICSKEQEEPLTKEVEKTEKEFGPLSYYQLTGKPDLRPPTYEDLASNIVYSSSGRAYVGFDSRKEAEEFLNSISEPAMIGDTDTMNGFKYEVKFYCDRSYLEELLQTPPSSTTEKQGMTEEKEEVQTPNYEKIDGQLHYNHVDSIVYVAFRAKGRADNYGSYLTRILDIGEKYTVSNKPSFFDSKYELRIEGVDFDSVLHLQNFNLSKEYDHSVNKEARELWRESRKRVYPPACRPSDKLVPLEEVKLGDIVYLNSINNQYKVLAHRELDGVPHIEVLCTYNPERPSLIGLTSFLKECYLVPAESIRIDSQLQKENTTKIEVVKSKPILKSNPEFTENDFPSAPYKPIPLAEVEVCDVISTGEHITTYYEVTQNLGDCIKARCLYSRAFPKRVGEEYTLSTIYLVEKSTNEVVAA